MSPSTHYGRSRVFFNVDRCPSCGRDHPEMEFKLTAHGLIARCPRVRARLKLVGDTDIRLVPPGEA